MQDFLKGGYLEISGEGVSLLEEFKSLDRELLISIDQANGLFPA